MKDDAVLPPIPIPRRLDRRMRLGPFPSAREAMRFAAYAAAGALVVPVGGAVAWLPILGAGFLLCVVRPDWKGFDDQVGDYLRYRWRRHRAASRGPAPAPSRRLGTGSLEIPGPFVASMLVAEGVPIRFLPPSDARALFERYRELLRSLDLGFHLDVGSRALRSVAAFVPGSTPLGAPEESARAGYREMTKLLLARRRMRRVGVLLFEPGADAGAVDRLESRTRAFAQSLASMGVRADRLGGRALERAAEEMGWPPGGRR
ncbi:MAG TPA: hypothetical protein VGX00_03980 [Thermoplasmata archaeon]|nr:hypothetical protein [Thermoplasmata archaeon]